MNHRHEGGPEPHTYQSTTRPCTPTTTTTARLHDDVGSDPASPEEEVDEREMTQSGEGHSPEGSPSSPPLHIPVLPFLVADDDVVPRARKPALRRPEAVAANQGEDNSSEDPDALHIQFEIRPVRAWTKHARNIGVPVVLATQEHRRLHREFCMRFEKNIEETFQHPPHPPHLLVRDYRRHPQSDGEVRDEVLEIPTPTGEEEVVTPTGDEDILTTCTQCRLGVGRFQGEEGALLYGGCLVEGCRHREEDIEPWTPMSSHSINSPNTSELESLEAFASGEVIEEIFDVPPSTDASSQTLASTEKEATTMDEGQEWALEIAVREEAIDGHVNTMMLHPIRPHRSSTTWESLTRCA